MKNWLLVGAMSVAGTASAGVRIETVVRDMNTLAPKGITQVTEVQNGAVRSSSPGGSVLLKGGKMIIIDDQQRTYSEMDKAAMEGYAQKANAAMVQMQEQLKNMPPEQRAQMEKMMGGLKMPGTSAGSMVFDARDTGKSDTVEGRKCRVWQMTQDGNVIDEMCVVPFASLPGKEDMQKTMKQLSEAFSGMASAMPGAAEQVKVRNSVNGYPVRSRPYLNGKPQGVESVLKSWTETNIPAATFEIPAGYKKKDMPQMGQ
ncbi:MAG TPA: DUF4412 domain-containing protein [Steroidobacteraceae bacterium]|nr:DUF4412 domain-containing protein [Steroidobacteraceae bacterium]